MSGSVAQLPDEWRELDWLEQRLGECRYLVGDSPTLADWRLFTTLLRFDSVHCTHFKRNNKLRVVDYPSLWGFARELYQWPGVAETVDFSGPHGRERVGA